MGTNYYLSCVKCRKAVQELYSLDLYEAAELIEADFRLEKFDSESFSYNEINDFIQKHKDHGGFFLYFSI